MSAARDFDFFHGSWSVAHRKLRERLAQCDEWLTLHGTAVCVPVLRGLGNTDRCTLDGSEWEGMTLRLFDEKTKLWAIHWADTSGARLDPALYGTFENGTGTFFGDDQHNGQPVRIRFIWRDLGPDHATWEQAFSNDHEATWETNWTMDFTRLREPLPDPAPPSAPR